MVHVECNAPNALPVFTAALSATTLAHPQPRWLCAKHRKLFKHTDSWGKDLKERGKYAEETAG